MPCDPCTKVVIIYVSTSLKTHDYHVIIKDILPIVVNISSLENGQRLEIIRLSLILKRMSLHVLDPSKFDNLREDVVEVLCLLEKKVSNNYILYFYAFA